MARGMRDGTATAINGYDEYGVPGPSTGVNNNGRFRYTGQVWLPELGLYYYKARMYSPTIGRFMQTDPIGYADGMNMYAYVGNDPVNGVDPTGLFRTCWQVPSYNGQEPDDGQQGSNTVIVVSASQRCVDWDLPRLGGGGPGDGYGGGYGGGGGGGSGSGNDIVVRATPQNDPPCSWAPLSGADAQLADDIQRSNLFHISARLAIARTAQTGNEHLFFIVRLADGGFGTTNIFEGRPGDTGRGSRIAYNSALQTYGDRLVGQFHTHPGNRLYPSRGDGNTANERGILSFIAGDNGQELGNVVVGKERICK